MSEKTISIVYRFKDGLYVNLTNRCPNLCVFCIKTKWDMKFDGNNLNLGGREPSADEVLARIREEMAVKKAGEIVFCGYGESTYRMEEMLSVAEQVKKEFPGIKTRLNTVGLGNVINGRNIVPEMEGKIDEIFISLNTADPQEWARIVRPNAGFKGRWADVVEFIKDAVGHFKRVVVSAVDGQCADTQKLKNLVERLGATFYLRSFLDD